MMSDGTVDPVYEYNAPRFIDFTQVQSDENIDAWFDNHVEEDDGKPFQEKDVAGPSADINDVEEEDRKEKIKIGSPAGTDEIKQDVQKELIEITPKVATSVTESHAKTNTSAEKEGTINDNDQVSTLSELWGSVMNEGQVPSNLRTTWAQNDSQKTDINNKRAKAKVVGSAKKSTEEMQLEKIETERKRISHPSKQTEKSKLKALQRRSVTLTTPSTPAFVRRAKAKVIGSAKKSTEEMQLEKIEVERKRISHLSEQNEKSRLKALHASPYMPTRSSKGLTQPVQFSFQTDQVIAKHKKEHSMVLRSDNNKETGELAAFDFARELRKNNTKSSSSTTGSKCVKPFNFATASRKRKADEDQEISQNKRSYVPMAELINNIQTETPKRFRSLSTAAQNVGPQISKQHDDSTTRITHPKSPCLRTRSRSRSSINKEQILSYKDREEQEIDDMKKHKFKARPFDAKMFKNSCTTGIKNKATAATTTPVEFNFHSAKRVSGHGRKREDNNHTGTSPAKRFKAQPVPKSVLHGVSGVKRVEQAPLTVPQSPKLMVKERHTHYEEKMLENNNEQPYVFKANPIPPDVVDVPPKKHISPTKIQPFAMPGVKYSEAKQHKFQEKLEEEQRRDEIHFKARPNVVTYQKPFEPQRSAKPLTDVTGFKLNTSVRKEERQKFEEQKKSNKEFAKMLEMRRKKEIEEVEKKEVMELRKQMVLKANPVHHYKTVDVHGSDKPLTIPYSPKFVKRRSLRT